MTKFNYRLFSTKSVEICASDGLANHESGRQWPMGKLVVAPKNNIPMGSACGYAGNTPVGKPVGESPVSLFPEITEVQKQAFDLLCTRG